MLAFSFLSIYCLFTFYCLLFLFWFQFALFISMLFLLISVCFFLRVGRSSELLFFKSEARSVGRGFLRAMDFFADHGLFCLAYA